MSVVLIGPNGRRSAPKGRGGRYALIGGGLPPEPYVDPEAGLFRLLTEGGDFLMTEGDDYLRTEQS